jgi:hypothetical protein
MLVAAFSLQAPAQTAQKATGTATKAGGSAAKAAGGSSGTSCGDKLQVTSFTVTPGSPLPGQTVTAKMTVKHLCASGSVNVPWKLFVGSTQIGGGTKTGLAGGASFDATATWTAASGQHLFDGVADGDKTLGESSANHGNNYPKGVTVNVPKLVTQILKWSSAASAGAQFATAAALQSNLAQCSPVGQFDPQPSLFPDFAQFSIVYSINCVIAPVVGMGGYGELEAFKSLQLKNNWKVKEVAETNGPTMNTTFQWLSKPAQGSGSPYLKVNMGYSVIALNPVQAPGAGQPSTLVKAVKVIIEGPEGTSPY